MSPVIDRREDVNDAAALDWLPAVLTSADADVADDTEQAAGLPLEQPAQTERGGQKTEIAEV